MYDKNDKNKYTHTHTHHNNNTLRQQLKIMVKSLNITYDI